METITFKPLYLASAKVLVDEIECGVVSSEAKLSTWYTVNCPAETFGRSIKVVGKENFPIQFAEIYALRTKRS